MRRWSFVAAALFLGVTASPAAAGEVYVAFYNVENLFDTEDDPHVEGDEEFTPAGPKNWTPQRLTIKLKNLAGVIQKMNQGKGPDVLGLCEIENRKVVELLVRQLAPLGRDYKVVHQDSPSGRGIDVAVVYDAAKLSLGAAKFHPVAAGKTRDVVETSFTAGGHALTLFANHWPSRSTNPEAMRVKAAQTLRARLDALLAANAAADILVLGDLNDYPTSPSVKDHLKTTDDPARASGGTFYNTMWPLHHAKRGSYVYENKWDVLDHLIVSPGLLDAAGFRWRPGSTTEVKFPEQIFTPANPQQIPRPNRSYSGNVFHPKGISDHLPVACVLEY